MKRQSFLSLLHRRFLGVIALALLVVAGGMQPARATGIPVVDVANLVENIRQAFTTIQQYMETVQHYQQWMSQYRDLKDNWRSIVGLNDLLLAMGRDSRLGYSGLTVAQYLDANSPEWRDNIETLLRLHYSIPNRSQLTGDILRTYGRGADSYIALVEREYQQRTQLLDPYHFQAAQEFAARDRQSTIDRLQGSMNSLGDRSQQQQLQAIGAALTLLARQNEAMIDASHIAMTQSQYDQFSAISGVEQMREAEFRRQQALRTATTPCLNDCLEYW